MKYLSFIFILICFASCNNEPKTIIIDNPTDKPITVKFEQTEAITIQPMELKKLEIIFRDEKISINGASPVPAKLDPKKEYFINAGYQEYYIQKIPYFLNPNGEKRYKQKYGEPLSRVGNIQLPGDIKPLPNVLVIEKHWDLDLDQEAKPYIKFKKATDTDFYLVQKMVRPSDIMMELFKQLKPKIDH